MKKKILALCLVVVLAVTAVTGATLAYFTDTETETNTFTAGNVDITLNEVFDEQTAKLVPGVDINKDVTITLEEGSEESYVWYTYAIPAVLDNANGDASANIVHVNHAGANWLGYQNNENYWAEGQTEATPADQCWIIDNKVIGTVVGEDGITYNVYVVLYSGTLTAGEETTVGMTNVYLDTKVDVNEEGTYTINGEAIDYDFSEGVNIIVNAYAIQAAGFDNVQDAYAAYNAQYAAE